MSECTCKVPTCSRCAEGFFQLRAALQEAEAGAAEIKAWALWTLGDIGCMLACDISSRPGDDPAREVLRRHHKRVEHYTHELEASSTDAVRAMQQIAEMWRGL